MRPRLANAVFAQRRKFPLTSDYHARLSLSFPFFRLEIGENFPNEMLHIPATLGPNLKAVYEENLPLSDPRMQQILSLLTDNVEIYRRLDPKCRTTINTLILRNFDELTEKFMARRKRQSSAASAAKS